MIVFYRDSTYTVIEPGQGPVSSLSWSNGKVSPVPDDVLPRVLEALKGGASVLPLWLEEGTFYEPAIVTTAFRSFIRLNGQIRHMFKEECDITLPAIELANRAFWKSDERAARDQARVTALYQQWEQEDREEEEERSQDLCICGELRKTHSSISDHSFRLAEGD